MNSYQWSVKWSLAGSLATTIFQLAQMVAFARIAGPQAAGVYALAAAVISFLTPLAEAGLSQAVVQAETVHRQQLIRLAFVNVGICVAIFIGIGLAGPILARWYGSAELPELLLLMSSSLLFTPIGAQRSALLLRAMQFELLAKIEVASWCISMTATIGLACLDWGALAMAAGFFLRNLVATIGSVLAQPRLPIDTHADTSIKEYLKFGLFDLSGRWAEFLANYLDKLIVGKALGIEALGYYNLAFTFLMLPTARIGYVITRVTFPLYARIKSKSSEIQAFYDQTSREIIVLLFPIYTAMALFAQEIVLILFGAKWLPAAPLFIAFGLAGMVRTLSAPFPQLIRGLGKPQIWLIWLLVFTSLLNVSLICSLSFQASPSNAAWSRTLVKFLVEIPLLYWLARYLGLQFQPILYFAGSLLCWLAPVALCTWLVGNIPGSWLWILTAKTSVFLLGVGWLALKSPAYDVFINWIKKP